MNKVLEKYRKVFIDEDLYEKCFISEEERIAKNINVDNYSKNGYGYENGKYFKK